MKKKIVRLRGAKCIKERLSGVCLFRITGPSATTGKRVTIEFEGTREDAEKVELK